MRIPGLSLMIKPSAFLIHVYHSVNLKNIEAWIITAYITWWPVIARLFQ